MFLARALHLIHLERKVLIRDMRDMMGTRTDHLEWEIKGLTRAMELVRTAAMTEKKLRLERRPERLAPRYYSAMKTAHHLLTSGQRKMGIKRLEKELYDHR